MVALNSVALEGSSVFTFLKKMVPLQELALPLKEKAIQLTKKMYVATHFFIAAKVRKTGGRVVYRYMKLDKPGHWFPSLRNYANLSLTGNQQIQVCIFQIEPFTQVKIGERAFEQVNAAAQVYPVPYKIFESAFFACFKQ